ncbi:MAG: sigma factor-like helix-turn-helix DNA-binding protein [Eubacteriales bacterium]|jgi:DNA-binding transcriptional regulator LsrR (DeoR family)|nr:sigma-70 family RNA polymerase sigma factor [Bacillota bacterium]MBV1727952.1 sigma-70 family RNA polymerase sigma factor [Desulforudis sp.]MDQ7789112.1 sigma factor-like helix-turn-helix DNA-binding protein [Clostridia bacterium]MDZ4042241.1 sigma factor-like helix-turn-helix DNA-binding protein [Eubacteriales bacterium]MBU4554927.1 sigma-70 family RNA polymerase sigma factor [Bacillota bacterium]
MQIEIRGAERLSFRERQVVVLKEMNHSTDAIAKQLGLSASTVGTLYNRARTKGYQVVILIAGDPLGLFGGNDEGDGDDIGGR